jgi:NADPH:quinone reductase-like Zn-dependent oxidoreductase
MKMMKVMRFNDSSETPALLPANAPVDLPASRQVQIRLFAAGVTPTELGWYTTVHSRDGGQRAGAIPGHEFSGVIEAVGEGVDAHLVGQEVYGMNDWFADGATAEYCLTTPNAIAAKPARLSHAEAATVPIGALTAWQGLFDRLKLQAGERVLIHGGAGAVGSFAVQLARRCGAEVIATASAGSCAFLTQLGVSEMIDYRASRFEQRVGQVDAVFDAVGGETLRRSWEVLAPKGRLVTIAAESEGAQDERTKQAFFIVEPNGEQLTEISRLIEAGELHSFVAAEVPLASASAAYLGTVPGRRAHGKVVVNIRG